MGPGNYYLQHVNAEQDDHRLRAEVVQPADQPAEVHLVLNEIDARPRRAVAGAVRRHEEDARHKLKHENERQAASPHIAPLGSAGDVFDEQHFDEFAEACAVVQPLVKRCAHDVSSSKNASQAFARAAGYALGTLSCLPWMKF